MVVIDGIQNASWELWYFRLRCTPSGYTQPGMKEHIVDVRSNFSWSFGTCDKETVQSCNEMNPFLKSACTERCSFVVGAEWRAVSPTPCCLPELGWTQHEFWQKPDPTHTRGFWNTWYMGSMVLRTVWAAMWLVPNGHWGPVSFFCLYKLKTITTGLGSLLSILSGGEESKLRLAPGVLWRGLLQFWVLLTMRRGKEEEKRGWQFHSCLRPC